MNEIFQESEKRENYEDRQLSIWWLAPWLPVQLVFSPDIVKSLVKKKQHDKPFLYELLGEIFLLDGILVADVKKWKKRRKLLTWYVLRGIIEKTDRPEKKI